MAAITPPSEILISFCSLIGSPAMKGARATAPERLVGASGWALRVMRPGVTPSTGHCCHLRSSARTESPRLMSVAATRTSVAPTVFSTVSTSRGPDTIFLATQAAPTAAVKAIASTMTLALRMINSSFWTPHVRDEWFTLTVKSQRQVNGRAKLRGWPENSASAVAWAAARETGAKSKTGKALERVSRRARPQREFRDRPANRPRRARCRKAPPPSDYAAASASLARAASKEAAYPARRAAAA